MDSFEHAICVILIISIVMVVAGIAGFIYDSIKGIKNLTKKAKWVKLVPYTHLVQETIYFTGQILYEKKIKTYPAFKIYNY